MMVLENLVIILTLSLASELCTQIMLLSFQPVIYFISVKVKS
jgi:hypothetical protein